MKERSGSNTARNPTRTFRGFPTVSALRRGGTIRRSWSSGGITGCSCRGGVVVILEVHHAFLTASAVGGRLAISEW